MDKEWNPGFWRIKKGTLFQEFVPYEKKWYCYYHKLIHQTEKEKNNCKYCSENDGQINTKT
jgi:hypothetical protein